MLEAIDFVGRHKLKVFQFLPINETAPDNSPYNAISSLALDPVYLTIAPDMVPGLSPTMIAESLSDELLASLADGPVKYDVVKALKLKLLADAFEAFEKEKGKRAGRICRLC